ncbi:Nodulation protein D 2 [Pigmentiphaga humi]|uniref:Nodulation protein D 2 n=1 Tax=Pigmentiphaga humi TaxID=2478468 RepID=A0A3P4B5X6_9BURK|nr:LysR family transcriptional regulator [Pigmentiphaga humi]VCU71068.1 Nodulation protein D 2 [Pigmentiphaga humi]
MSQLLDHFDLNLLVVFEALYLERNVTRAGERIGMSQPSMSHALNRLRKQTGDALFTRVGGEMYPTRYAQQMASNVLQALELLRAGMDRVNDFDPATSQRTFKLLMSDFAQLLVIPALLSRIAETAPNVKLEVSSIGREHYRDALESGEADLAVGHLQELQSGFYQLGLFVDEHVCVLGPKSAYRGDSMSLDAYLQANHVLVTANKTDINIDKELARQGLHRQIRLRVPSYLLLPAIMAETDMFVTVPRVIARRVIAQAGGGRQLPLPFKTPQVNLRAFWHVGMHSDSGNRWLRGMVAGLPSLPRPEAP